MPPVAMKYELVGSGENPDLSVRFYLIEAESRRRKA